MKKFALAAVLAAAASTSFAGGFSEPEVIAPEPPAETGTGSAMGYPGSAARRCGRSCRQLISSHHVLEWAA